MNIYVCVSVNPRSLETICKSYPITAPNNPVSFLVNGELEKIISDVVKNGKRYDNPENAVKEIEAEFTNDEHFIGVDTVSRIIVFTSFTIRVADLVDMYKKYRGYELLLMRTLGDFIDYVISHRVAMEKNTLTQQANIQYMPG